MKPEIEGKKKEGRTKLERIHGMGEEEKTEKKLVEKRYDTRTKRKQGTSEGKKEEKKKTQEDKTGKLLYNDTIIENENAENRKKPDRGYSN